MLYPVYYSFNSQVIFNFYPILSWKLGQEMFLLKNLLWLVFQVFMYFLWDSACPLHRVGVFTHPHYDEVNRHGVALDHCAEIRHSLHVVAGRFQNSSFWMTEALLCVISFSQRRFDWKVVWVFWKLSTAVPVCCWNRKTVRRFFS